MKITFEDYVWLDYLMKEIDKRDGLRNLMHREPLRKILEDHWSDLTKKEKTELEMVKYNEERHNTPLIIGRQDLRKKLEAVFYSGFESAAENACDCCSLSHDTMYAYAHNANIYANCDLSDAQLIDPSYD